MLVVLGIVGLVAAVTLPMIIPIMRARQLDSSLDIVKTACTLARSTAIQQRRMVNLTLLQTTDSTHGAGVVLTGYNFTGAVTAVGTVNSFTDNNQNWVTNSFQNCQVLLFTPGTPVPQQWTIQSNTGNTISTVPNLAWSSTVTYYVGNLVSNGGSGYLCIQDNYNSAPPSANWQPVAWNPLPQPGNVYVIMSSMSSTQPYCIHYPGNFSYNYINGVSTFPPDLTPDDLRFSVLKTFSQYMGETVQYLPQGCRFDFTAPYLAWNSFTPYAAGNTVADRGGVYFCLAANRNSEPPNANWQGLTAWTYVFLPDGEVWTLPANAATHSTASRSVPGPAVRSVVPHHLHVQRRRLRPEDLGTQNLMSATIVVYGTTGQVISQ